MKIRSTYYLAVLMAILSTSFLQAQEDDGEVYDLNPFVIREKEGASGYGTTNALGTRIKTDVSNLAQNVVSLNEEFLEDLKPTNLADAFRFVSGVSLAEGQYSGRVSIRGQQIGAIGTRDGLGERLSAPHASVNPDPIEVQRLEVIKGPSGVLYGNHNFGGVLNRITKRPQSVASTVLGTEYSFFDNSEAYYRVTLDSTGPLDEDKKVLYRVLVAYQDGDNHMHDTYKRQTYIGEIRFRSQPETDLWLRARYSDDNYFVAQDLWTDSEFNMPFGFVPQNSFIGNFFGDDQVDTARATNIETGLSHSFYIGEHRFDMRFRGNYGDTYGQRRTYISLGGLFYNNGAPLVVGETALTTRNSTYAAARAAGYDDIRENIIRRDIRNGMTHGWDINFDLKGELVFGSTRHEVLAYYNQGDGYSFQRRFRENWIAEKPSIFEKNSTDPTQVLDGVPVTRANEWTSTDSDGYSFGVADNMYLLDDKVILVGGLRYDSSEGQTFDLRENEARDPSEATHWTPGYGIVGKPAEGVSVFYQHSETFRPQNGFNQNGDRLKSLIGDNDEFGVKFDLMDGKLVATASHFDMLLENAPIKIINDDGSFFFDQVDDQVTDGWELDLAAQLADGLTFLVAVQDLNSIDKKTGRSVRSVPLGVTYKAIAKYAFQSEKLKGLNVGLNYEHINNTRYGESANRFTLPGYDLWGLFVNYRKDNYSIYLNVENLTDEWYIAGSTASLFMRSGSPRLVKTGFDYRF
jgi:iron complex outermembrane receptor protein